MPDLNRLRCNDIRLLLTVSLQTVLLTTTIVTRLGPDIKYFVGLHLGQFTFRWEMTRQNLFLWSQIVFYFYLVLVCADFIVYDQLFDRPPRLNVCLKSTGINVLRVMVAIFELVLLSENWTTELVNEFGIIGCNFFVRILALFLELALFFQVWIIRYQALRRVDIEL